MKAVDWFHPIDLADQWDGFNEPGIEHFAGSPWKNLAREVVQNSLDASIGSDSNPVAVKFNELDIEVNEVPSVDSLRKNFELCLEASKNESEKARRFFEGGLKTLTNSKIKVLVMSDYNTLGIVGPAENGKPFFAFMKAKGQSQKVSESASGSFGIGKFAPYALSSLRTVFVSTIYEANDGSRLQLSQGKAILMSHDDAEMNRHQGIGFWGAVDRCMPVEGQSSAVPSWLSRATAEDGQVVGTRLVVLGVDLSKEWREHLTASIASNFFGAISSGRLELCVSDRYQISASSLATLFLDPDVHRVFDPATEEGVHYEHCRLYHEALIADDVETARTQDSIFGLCELKILVREGLPRRVCFLRNGMFISDSLNIAGLKRFSDFKDFVAVFQCLDEEGAKLFRKMEPPRHDTFEPDRLDSFKEQKRAKKALKDIATWIRDQLNRYAKDEVTNVTSVDELKEFLPDDEGGDSGNPQTEINPFAGATVTLKPLRLPRSRHFQIQGYGSAEGPNEDDDDSNGGGGDEGEGNGDGEGGLGSLSGGSGAGGGGLPRVEFDNPRMIRIDAKRIRVAFTPLKSTKASMMIQEAGADSDYDCAIAWASTGIVQNGMLTFETVEARRYSVDLEFVAPISGAVKVVIYEV